MTSSTLKEQALRLTELRCRLLPKLSQHFQDNESCLGVILQCHLFTEMLLEELIRLALGSHGEAVLELRLTFDQKLTLASKLKLAGEMEVLPDFIVGSLRKLNSLRNRVAHQYEAQIAEVDIRELFVGLERGLPYADVFEHGDRLAVSRYSAFIFGEMLPKYESIGEPRT